MRYSYGIVDERKILLYKPQLFLKDKDLLIFPSKDFQKWHNDIKEFIDGLYQIDSWEMRKGKSMGIKELNLALGVINNITEELEHLFDSNKTSDSPYYYLSTLDEKYKKQRSSYTNDMKRCEMRIPVINEETKHKNLMKIVYDVNRDFKGIKKNIRSPKNE